MKKLITFALLTFIFVSCQKQTRCKIDYTLLKTNDSLIKKYCKNIELKKFLSKMKEPQLEHFNTEIYRFSIVGAFGNNEFYRLIKNGNSAILYSRKYFKYREDAIKNKEIFIDSFSKEKKSLISLKEWTNLKYDLEKISFWTLPVTLNERYLDGTEYLIEAYSPIKNNCTGRNLHITSRISPSDTTRYKALFKKVIQLSN